MKYDLSKGRPPGYYAVGEGFQLVAKGNELTERQAVPLIAEGIITKPKRPKAEREAASKGKDGGS